MARRWVAFNGGVHGFPISVGFESPQDLWWAEARGEEELVVCSSARSGVVSVEEILLTRQPLDPEPADMESTMLDKTIHN